MPVHPLSSFEREQIRSGIDRYLSVTAIAVLLGRARSTVWREISRNGGRASYSSVSAQQRCDQNLARPKDPLLILDPGLGAEVTRRLELLDSPMRISIELAQQGRSISHETIYQAIYTPGRGLQPGLGRCLHLKRRKPKRRGRSVPGSHSLGQFRSIHTRPVIAGERVEVGHLEGDQIVGAYNQSALITVFDRTSRYLWLASVNGKGKDATRHALIELLERIPPQLRKTLTWDQGSEMASHQEISQHCGIDIYIADPKSPWQRPTNENGNALVRRYVGKSTNLNLITNQQLRHIESRINTIPRPTLGWHTAHDTYTHHVATTD